VRDPLDERTPDLFIQPASHGRKPPTPPVRPAAPPNESPSDRIQRKFNEFHAEHPEVYAKLRELCFILLDKGILHYGIGALWERMRWHFMFEVRDSQGFKLNNNFRSRYARLLMEKEPRLVGFFETRELTSA
jgi:hypothetical protein